MMRVVITGGPCTGKTSLINTLPLCSFTIYNEVAREVIKQQLALGSNKVPWDNVTEFSKLVLADQISDFKNASNGVSVFDRGIPDILAYITHGNQAIFPDLETALQNHIYDKVFILTPAEEIYETDEERRESFENAVLIHKQLVAAYQSLGYTPIEIPLLPLDKRTELLIRLIHE